MVDLVSILAVSFGLAVVLGYGIVRIGKGQTDQLIKFSSGQHEELVELTKQVKTTDIPSAKIVERLVSLERRQEALEKDVIDRMKVVAQRERRIRDMQDSDDEMVSPEQIDEGKRILAGAPAPAAGSNGTENSEEDQLDWIRQFTRR
jgi:hypothetical protein